MTTIHQVAVAHLIMQVYIDHHTESGQCTLHVAGVHAWHCVTSKHEGLLIRTDLSVAAKFSNTCRYIDDLLTLNNPDFQACIGQIYPPELELKKTTESHDSCSYLDLNINVLNGKFCTDLYDKRDAFNFSIVNFPHMDSNIPSKPAYGVVISQLVRYLRICCNYQDFVYRSKLLTTRLLRQGYVYQKLCSTYKTFVHRYPRTLQKYGRCLKNIITECIAIATV